MRELLEKTTRNQPNLDGQCESAEQFELFKSMRSEIMFWLRKAHVIDPTPENNSTLKNMGKRVEFFCKRAKSEREKWMLAKAYRAALRHVNRFPFKECEDQCRCTTNEAVKRNQTRPNQRHVTTDARQNQPPPTRLPAPPRRDVNAPPPAHRHREPPATNNYFRSAPTQPTHADNQSPRPFATTPPGEFNHQHRPPTERRRAPLLPTPTNVLPVENRFAALEHYDNEYPPLPINNSETSKNCMEDRLLKLETIMVRMAHKLNLL